MASKTTEMLVKAGTEFASAKAGDVISNLGTRAAGNGGNGKSEDGGDGEENKGFIGTTAHKMGEGKGPVKSLLSGAGAAIKGLFTRKGGAKRPHNIVEDAWIGAPVDVCFAAFVQWEDFPSFMKGPENVSRGEEKDEEELEEGEHPLEGEQTQWTGKIFINRRSWKATTIDYDPPNRISWTSEGAKGTIDGTVTFTPMGDNATLLLMVLEYRSKGPIEWIGQRWQTVGRRSRLDLKHFKRHVMRTEPDELPEPEDAEEIEDEAKAEDATNAEDQESEEPPGGYVDEYPKGPEGGDTDEEDTEDEPGEWAAKEGDGEPDPEDEEPEPEPKSSPGRKQDEEQADDPAPRPASRRRKAS